MLRDGRIAGLGKLRRGVDMPRQRPHWAFQGDQHQRRFADLRCNWRQWPLTAQELARRV